MRVDRDRGGGGGICGGLYAFHYTPHIWSDLRGEGSKTNKEYLHVHTHMKKKISPKRREVFFLYGHLLLKALSFFSPPGTRKRRRNREKFFSEGFMSVTGNKCLVYTHSGLLYSHRDALFI